MKKHGILNSHISKVLADLGHTDTIVVADCGLPIPDGVQKIDLALELGKPGFHDVLKIMLEHMQVEKMIIADEVYEHNQTELEGIYTLFEKANITSVSHEAFKALTANAKVIIRTGEATPYANCILQAGVIF